MLLVKLNSKIEYHGLIYKLTNINKKKITLSGKTILDIEPNRFIQELIAENLRILEI